MATGSFQTIGHEKRSNHIMVITTTAARVCPFPFHTKPLLECSSTTDTYIRKRIAPFKVLFCLARHRSGHNSSLSSCQHGTTGNGNGSGVLLQLPQPTSLSRDICQSHDALVAADPRQNTVNNSYRVCFRRFDVHSSPSSISLSDESQQSIDRESDKILIYDGQVDSSVTKGNDLEKHINRAHKPIDKERFLHVRQSGSGCYLLNPHGLSVDEKRKGYWFPYMDKFKSGSVTLSSSEVLQAFDPYIVESRKQRITEVVRNRTYSICLVVEGLTDFGNISAVFRSADALGFQSVHVISNDNAKRYRQNRKVSMGSEKWLDIEQWETTRECFEVMRLRGYRIAVAHIASDAVSICDMDWTLPTAVVLGNEHRGVSDEALDLSDIRCSIPMVGMVDSLNVSVAAGICMHASVHDRISRMVSNILLLASCST